MGFNIDAGVSALAVFLQGLVSFLSPCVLPLVPLYVSYLAGGAKTVDENGVIHYPRRKVLVNTIFFVLGISFTFFLLGFGFTTLGRFFSDNRTLFARISGIVMLLFGLYQLGVFGHSQSIEREHRLPLRLDRWAMNPITALVLGFTFSFAWTPCVGPVLASVLLMASSASSAAAGFGLIGVYTLGFTLPFLAVGLFTGVVLDFFKRHQSVVKYTVKIGGVLLVLMGIMTFTGFMNGITGYLSGVGNNPAPPAASQSQTVPEATPEAPAPAESTPAESESAPAESQSDLPPAPDFTLVDQYGNEHTLSDYKGKTVFLNFWATWCGPCAREMPEIQKLYEKYGENSEDLIVLAVANPKSDAYPRNADVSQPEVEQYLTDGGYTFPVVMDLTGDVFGQYGITAFPTTFMITVEGDVFGYASGSLTGDIMESIVQQTMTGKRA